MKFLILFLVASVAFSEPTPTDRYLGYTGELLEQKHLGDEHLLWMIAGAEQGQVVSPISENEARVSIVHQVAKQTYAYILKESVDVQAIIPWAKERLSQEAREREEKKKKSEDTRAVTINRMSQVISSGPFHVCGILRNETIKCWGGANYSGELNPPQNSGFSSLHCHSYGCCAISRFSTLSCWGSPHQYKAVSFPVKNIISDYNTFCVIDLEDRLKCFGEGTIESEDGRGGSATLPLLTRYLPEELPKIWKAVLGIRGEFLCIHLKKDLTVQCFGHERKNSGTSNFGPVSEIAATAFNMWALLLDGRVVGWSKEKNIPEVKELPGSVRSISASSNEVCALLDDHTVRCWNHSGSDYALPSEAEQRFKSISAGGGFVCGVSMDDDAICFKIHNRSSNEIDPEPPRGLGKLLGQSILD